MARRASIANNDSPALEQQRFDVAKAQLKLEMPAHGATDDGYWKAVAVTKRCYVLHRAGVAR